MTQTGKGGADEIISRSCGFKQRSKEYEHKDHAGRDPQGDAVDAFCCQPVMRHALYQTGSFMGDNVGHIGTQEGVADKDQRHHH